MIEGLILMVLALALACASPAGRQLDQRKIARAELIAPHLERAFVVPAPDPALDTLVANADAALDRDPHSRMTRGIARVYDRA